MENPSNIPLEKTTGNRKHPLHITSEIGTLKTVLLHRPGREVENLIPDHLERLLFEDIPFLPAVQKEHDFFAATLEKRGVEVLYLDRLAAESLKDEGVREQFIDQFLAESNANIYGTFHILKEYLLSMQVVEMVRKVMAGILKTEIAREKKKHLYEFVTDYDPFYTDPMPNLYFTRDPAAVIGNGITINRMREEARRRESIFMEYILKYHPHFSGCEIPVWLNRNERFSIEGGDELVLSRDTVAIGVSSRTSAKAIENLAVQLFRRQENIRTVVAVEIPKSRAFMHLDTVFTMVDHDKFTIHPAIQGPDEKMRIYLLEKSAGDGHIVIRERNHLAAALKEVLHLQEIDFIPCGGGDFIASAREQWNDGSNTLTIAPGVVVTYDRNYVSNEMLRQHGIEVIEVLSSELSRGRGGPRCMSMPLARADLESGSS
ncbi:arginine deiminase [Heyndrickxia acidiproducens]|uniref:arginine deiminase n=1 Tax=Heyndrickxia acidiproducens TaxID=1121084 RepID=UPI00037BC221|nr:arginine deiminase [Heyndrickxia acidiproducens]